MFPHFMWWINCEICHSITHSSKWMFQFAEFNEINVQCVHLKIHVYWFTSHKNIIKTRLVALIQIRAWIFATLSPNFELFHYMTSLLFILSSFRQWNLSQQFLSNLELLRTKSISFFFTMGGIGGTVGGILCGAIMSEQWKIRKSSAV